MADKTKIEWADATVNAINGCSLASPGCINCYAMKQAHRVEARRGLTVQSKGGMVWTGDVRLNEKALMLPLSWKAPRRIFWNAHGDTFHENVPDEWIDRVFAVCALTPQHTHMILTKRPERMLRYMTFQPRPDKYISIDDEGNQFPTPKSHWDVHAAMCQMFPKVPPRQLNFAAKNAQDLGFEGFMCGWPLPNVWLGTSVEDQPRTERIDHLRNTPAAKRFISFEPLIGDVGQVDLTGIDWAIVGGESGPKARPMHPDWARSLRDQCAAAGVAFHFKQWGEWGTACFNTTTGHEVFRQFKDFHHWVNKANTWVAGGICLDTQGNQQPPVGGEDG